jgi:hypothetical protein
MRDRHKTNERGKQSRDPRTFPPTGNNTDENVNRTSRDPSPEHSYLFWRTWPLSCEWILGEPSRPVKRSLRSVVQDAP